MSVYKSVVYHVMVSAVQGNELILDFGLWVCVIMWEGIVCAL